MNHRAAGEAFAAREWRRAFDLYSGAADLDGEDLDCYAQCAMLLNRMDDYFVIRERAYEELRAGGDLVGAALAAFWSGMQHMVDGEVAAGGGWLARAARLVKQDGSDSVPRACLGLSAASLTGPSAGLEVGSAGDDSERGQPGEVARLVLGELAGGWVHELVAVGHVGQSDEVALLDGLRAEIRTLPPRPLLPRSAALLAVTRWM